jgi:hypothetical protein
MMPLRRDARSRCAVLILCAAVVCGLSPAACGSAESLPPVVVNSLPDGAADVDSGSRSHADSAVDAFYVFDGNDTGLCPPRTMECHGACCDDRYYQCIDGYICCTLPQACGRVCCGALQQCVDGQCQ